MRWKSCTTFNICIFIVIIGIFVQVDGKIRRRRQYFNNNYGAYALDPAVASYYGSSGGGIYTGNSQQNNRFIVGGVTYKYPTPVNVMSGGSYNPQENNAFPSGSDAYYYANMNNMRLPSPDGWYSAYYYQRYPFPILYNDARHITTISTVFKLIFTLFICRMYIIDL